MCGESPKVLLYTSLRLWSMKLVLLWYEVRYLGVALGHLILCMGRLQLLTMSIFWAIRCIRLSRFYFQDNASFIKTTEAPIHIAKIVRMWFEEHEEEVGHLAWPRTIPWFRYYWIFVVIFGIKTSCPISSVIYAFAIRDCSPVRMASHFFKCCSWPLRIHPISHTICN